MKRAQLALVILAAIPLVAASPSHAQMGMDLFKRPSITKAFHPVVGKGAVYLDTDKDGKASRTSEISIVGKDSFEGKDSYWMQIYSTDPQGKTFLGKSLITPADFQIHRMIFQPQGQQAMEMPMRMNAARKEKIEENMADWHSVGTDSITVPAGTFSCEHWRNEKTHAEVWTSDKVVPFGMVKEISANGSTQVLSKLLDNAADRITGPVKQFDMQQMMQQMQQEHQQHP
ncbi:MAG TPA: hypothetical protein VNH19_23040 [Candidatus Limnocylindrales bacterium]|nr:hypothetical protein [Candidatus Limnocylindrales bacterium]